MPQSMYINASYLATVHAATVKTADFARAEENEKEKDSDCSGSVFIARIG